MVAAFKGVVSSARSITSTTASPPTCWPSTASPTALNYAEFTRSRVRGRAWLGRMVPHAMRFNQPRMTVSAWVGILHQLCPRCRRGRIFCPLDLSPPPAHVRTLPGVWFEVRARGGYFLGAMYFSYALGTGTISLLAVIGVGTDPVGPSAGRRRRLPALPSRRPSAHVFLARLVDLLRPVHRSGPPVARPWRAILSLQKNQ